MTDAKPVGSAAKIEEMLDEQRRGTAGIERSIAETAKIAETIPKPFSPTDALAALEEEAARDLARRRARFAASGGIMLRLLDVGLDEADGTLLLHVTDGKRSLMLGVPLTEVAVIDEGTQDG